jgi:putative flippase GtrA
MKINRRHVFQVMKFGVVGVFATLTHYFSALFILEVVGQGVYVANLIGYCTAIFVSYFGHAVFTFKAQLGGKGFLRFTIFSVLTFIGGQVVLFVLKDLLHTSDRWALAFTVVAIPVVSFFVNKFLVFKS